MTETSTPHRSPLAVPALVVGALGLLFAVVVRAAIGGFLAAPLAIVAVVLGHLALAKTSGPGRWIAIGGLVAGYLTLAIAVAWMIAIALR